MPTPTEQKHDPMANAHVKRRRTQQKRTNGYVYKQKRDRERERERDGWNEAEPLNE